MLVIIAIERRLYGIERETVLKTTVKTYHFLQVWGEISKLNSLTVEDPAMLAAEYVNYNAGSRVFQNITNPHGFSGIDKSMLSKSSDDLVLERIKCSICSVRCKKANKINGQKTLRFWRYISDNGRLQALRTIIPLICRMDWHKIRSSCVKTGKTNVVVLVYRDIEKHAKEKANVVQGTWSVISVK